MFGSFWEVRSRWEFWVAIGVVVVGQLAISLVTLFVSLPLLGSGAVASSSALALTNIWQPPSRQQFAWSSVHALEVRRVRAGHGTLCLVSIIAQDGDEELSVRCPYYPPLLRAIVSRASLTLQVAPDNWQALTKGTNDPFVVLKRQGRPVEQRWVWSLAKVGATSHIEPKILVTPRQIDFGTLAPQSLSTAHRSVTVANVGEIDARCGIVGCPLWLLARPKLLSLPPGTKQVVELTMQTNKIRGRKRQATLTFALEGGKNHEVEVALRVDSSRLFG
jgi:hypothetical protein